MRVGGRYWLVAMVVGLAAIIILRATESLPAEQRHSIEVALVVLGTCVLAIFRLRSQSQRLADTARPQPVVPATPAIIEKRRVYAAWAGIGLIIVAWCSAVLLGNSFTDPESRVTILNSLSMFTAVVVTIALLLTPAATTSRASLVVFVAIVIAWFAGSILLPSISSWIWGSTYGFEKVVNAVPGRSFIPVAGFLIRSIGHHIGLKMWLGRQQ